MVLRDYAVLGDGQFFGESGFQLRENVGQLEHHCAGVGNQGFGIEPRRLPEDGARDFNRIVKGEFVDDLVWHCQSGPAALQAGRGPRLQSHPQGAQ